MIRVGLYHTNGGADMKTHTSIHMRDGTKVTARRKMDEGGRPYIHLELGGEGGYVDVYMSPEQWERIRTAVEGVNPKPEWVGLDEEAAALTH